MVHRGFHLVHLYQHLRRVVAIKRLAGLDADGLIENPRRRRQIAPARIAQRQIVLSGRALRMSIRRPLIQHLRDVETSLTVFHPCRTQQRIEMFLIHRQRSLVMLTSLVDLPAAMGDLRKRDVKFRRGHRRRF